MDDALVPTADAGWVLEVDGYEPLNERGVEARLTLGNGFLGVHGAPSLRADDSGLAWPGTYVAGLFDGTDTVPRVPMLRPSPDWLQLNVLVDGKPVMHRPQAMDALRRSLDMRRGLLLGFWPGAAGDAVRDVGSLRMASLAHRSIGLQMFRLDMDGSAEISVEAAVATATHGLIRTHLEPGLGVWRTRMSGRKLAMASASVLTLDGEELAPTKVDDLRWRWVWTSHLGQVMRLEHWVAFVRAQRGEPDPGDDAKRRLAHARGEGAAQNIADHTAAWAERWDACDVTVAGDKAAQQALRFSGYHVNSAANPADQHVSVGARALTGDAYLGHVFWDTEIYLLPFYTLTWPEAAKTLLMYRFRSLDAARAKAAKMGWRGAFFAWESTTTGREWTPEFVIGTDGSTIEILSGREEEHISADVAYAVWNYWQATQDEAFLLEAGAEILFETARFWSSRAKLEADGLRHIRDVEGPDEYHEHIDDNAFTNVMARWNLNRGLECAELLRAKWPDRWAALASLIALGDEELEAWRITAATLTTSYDAARGLYEQFAGFFNLEHIDLTAYAKRTTPMDVVLGRERTGRSQVIKQADTVALMALLPEEFDATNGPATFAYYEPRCDQSSSLSACMHAMVAARLGNTDLALRYFHQGAAIDLAAPASNSAGGVHIANQGGIWQAAVFGFAGLSLRGETVKLDPHLPKGWDALTFNVLWRGRRVGVRVEAAGPSATVTLAAGDPLTVTMAGETRPLTVGAPARFTAARATAPRAPAAPSPTPATAPAAPVTRQDRVQRPVEPDPA